MRFSRQEYWSGLPFPVHARHKYTHTECPLRKRHRLRAVSCFIWEQNEDFSPGVGMSDGSKVPAPKRWRKASVTCDFSEGRGTAVKRPLGRGLLLVPRSRWHC